MTGGPILVNLADEVAPFADGASGFVLGFMIGWTAQQSVPEWYAAVARQYYRACQDEAKQHGVSEPNFARWFDRLCERYPIEAR